jgi:hypothetical protein
MKYASDEELGYDPDAVEVAQHAREEKAWEQEPDAPDDTFTVNYRGVTPEGEWWEPKYADKTDADRLQYQGDKAAELAEAGDEYRDEIAADMTAAGVPADDVRQVVETASAWRGNEATADLEVEEQEEQEALAQPPYSAYGADPHQIDEQYWPAPEAELEAGADDGVMHGDTFYWLQPTTAGHAATREQQGDFAALPEDLQAQYLGDRSAELAEGDPSRRVAVTMRMVLDGVTPGDVHQVTQTADEWATTAQAQPSEPDRTGPLPFGTDPLPTREERSQEAGWRNGPGFLAAPSAEAAAAVRDEPAEQRQGRTEPESRVIVAGDEQQLAAVTVTRGRELPVPYELTELGAAQAVADQMTEREVGPGYLESVAADREAGS